MPTLDPTPDPSTTVYGIPSRLLPALLDLCQSRADRHEEAAAHWADTLHATAAEVAEQAALHLSWQQATHAVSESIRATPNLAPVQS